MSLLDYLRNTLADSDLIGAEPKNQNSYVFHFEDLKSGKINEVITERIFHDYEKELDSKNKNKKDLNSSETKQVKVLLYPLQYIPKIEHTKSTRFSLSDKFVYPLCLPAVLCREGKLYGDCDLSPFIPRLYLSPQSDNSYFPAVSSVGEQDDFFTHNKYALTFSDGLKTEEYSLISWSDCWAFGENLWKKLTNTNLREHSINGYMLSDQSAVLCSTLVTSHSLNILNLYNVLREENTQLPLLEKFLSVNGKEKKEIYKTNSSSLLLVNEKIIAQMNLGRALSASQKCVMDYFLENEDDLFLTVNGPPGTGKTTLIQSLIANIWVKAALDQTEPPIIVATSTNNNAVTNVIESFKTNSNSSDILFQRWLPDIYSFGTYCASSSQANKEGQIKKGWLVTEPYKNLTSHVEKENIIDVESLEYFNKAHTIFKKYFLKYFKQGLTNLSEIQSFLHKKLAQAANQIKVGCLYQKQLLTDFDKISEREKSIKLKRSSDDWLEKYKEFKRFERDAPFYIKALKLFPVLKKIIGKAEESYFREFYINELSDYSLKDLSSEALESFLEKHLRISRIELAKTLDDLAVRENHEKQWQQWCLDHNLVCEAKDLSKALDNHSLRTEIFYLATHYWEVRWLQDMEKWLNQKNKSAINLSRTWHRRAKLSPCLVTTLHMIPRFFREEEYYLYNFIDYLIVDEAGQVSPYIAAPSFALSKKAIIVGDTKQLEPINKIPKVIDKGNCKKYLLTQKKQNYKNIVQQGLSSSNSLMDRAHALCDFKLHENLDDPGFFLKEHWRCVPKIASYCNEIAYDGFLEPQRLEIKDRLYPAIGYAHIPGTAIKKGESRSNPLEAQVIGLWLKKNENKICKHYGNKPIEQIIAIITPFAAQISFLKNALNNQNIKSPIVVGTLHSLQGAERPIILFSSTYGEGDILTFVDKKVNFFNVAVSRAKDSFLIFGNMSLFNPASGSPSGRLASKLFAEEENEIVDIDLSSTINIRNLKDREFIDTLEDHRALLKRSLEQASQKLLIISPYISINALNEDNLCFAIKQAVKRGVQVSIITDHYLGVDRRESTEIGRKKLIEAGALLQIDNNIHDKIICVDDHTLIMGSFNWLSANRTKKYAKEERSSVNRGKEIASEINKYWKRVRG